MIINTHTHTHITYTGTVMYTHPYTQHKSIKYTLYERRWKFPATVVWKSHFKLLPPQWICMQYGFKPSRVESNHLCLVYLLFLVSMWHACDSNSKKCQAAALSWMLLFEVKAQKERFLAMIQNRNGKKNHQTHASLH